MRGDPQYTIRRLMRSIHRRKRTKPSSSCGKAPAKISKHYHDEYEMLDSRQRKFVEEFLSNFNATRAAMRLGYSRNVAKNIGSELLRTHEVTEAIANALIARTGRALGPVKFIRDIIARRVTIKGGLKRLLQSLYTRLHLNSITITSKTSKTVASSQHEPDDVMHVYHKAHFFYCYRNGTIAESLLLGKEWDPHLKRILFQHAAQVSEGVVVEVGANIGATFLPVCAEMPHLRFHLYEPVPAFYRLLERNTASFGAANVEIQNLAISDGDVADILLISDQVSAGITAAGVFRNRYNVTIMPAKSLDELYPNQRIVMLKADVDGYESDVFRGGANLLARSRPDIVFEFNPFALDVRGVPPVSILQFIANLGPYSFDVYSEQGVFIETTQSPQRVLQLFDAQLRPEGHCDVHAYISGEASMLKTSRT
jgi:FkbM family methyltransferase